MSAPARPYHCVTRVRFGDAFDANVGRPPVHFGLLQVQHVDLFDLAQVAREDLMALFASVTSGRDGPVENHFSVPQRNNSLSVSGRLPFSLSFSSAGVPSIHIS